MAYGDKRILMVCLGNICRSPMAEGILRHKAKLSGISVDIDSAGTADYHVGEEPDHRAIRCLKSHGIDISGLRARQFSRRDFDTFDMIYTMDASNHKNVLALANNDDQKNKVKMILNENNPGSDAPVPDPWPGGMDDFEAVYEMLSEACDEVIRKL